MNFTRQGRRDVRALLLTGRIVLSAAYFEVGNL